MTCEDWREDLEEYIAPKTAAQRRIADYKAKYYAENKERIAAYSAKYRAENKERIANYNAKYYAENKELFRDMAARYELKNRLDEHNAAMGLALRQARKDKGLTQGALAALVGLDASSICKYERGRIPFDPGIFDGILEVRA
jgi:DNA-binding XRE family transcriptional regulator